LREGNREHPADAAREHDVQVAAESPEDGLDGRAEPVGLEAMTLPGGGAGIVVVLIRMNAIARPRLAVRLERVRGDAVQETADRGVPGRPEGLEPPEILREQVIARLAHGSFSQ